MRKEAARVCGCGRMLGREEASEAKEEDSVGR